ncbi:hypothetical protein JHK82_052814 [Glycine max]|nr:hypothetical protein JHK86_052667 [Glycine max]KAG4927032.1 hypothetical protein JHK85_053518 [Glycine max]KAG5082658.1 hypothetical protein JHK84_052696 [Glycine max]KAG5085417.1 hypothetical protein JHK82_052814 [Glycine max]
MASLNSMYVVLAFALSLNLLIHTSLSSETPQPSQGPSTPKPLSAYEKYLSDCASKFKPRCGEQIFFGVFVGNQTVTNRCCLSLLNDMGKACHTDVTKFAVSLPTFKQNQTQILKRSEKAIKAWILEETDYEDKDLASKPLGLSILEDIEEDPDKRKKLKKGTPPTSLCYSKEQNMITRRNV